MLAILCAELIWKGLDFLPGFLLLCCKRELLTGISLFCSNGNVIICHVSRWLVQVMEEENRATTSGISAAVPWDCSHKWCTAPSTSWARHLSLEGCLWPSSEPNFLIVFYRLCIFFHNFPTCFQRICVCLIVAPGAKHLFQPEGIKDNFWNYSCKWVCMYKNTHIWIQREALAGHY